MGGGVCSGKHLPEAKLWGQEEEPPRAQHGLDTGAHQDGVSWGEPQPSQESVP